LGFVADELRAHEVLVRTGVIDETATDSDVEFVDEPKEKLPLPFGVTENSILGLTREEMKEHNVSYDDMLQLMKTNPFSAHQYIRQLK